jgi:hypothetical protein
VGCGWRYAVGRKVEEFEKSKRKGCAYITKVCHNPFWVLGSLGPWVLVLGYWRV